MSARQGPSSETTLAEATNRDAATVAWKNGRFYSRFVFPFDLPSTPQVLAVRIAKNFSHFGLLYALVLWVGLSISLLPARRTSLFILLLMTLVTNSFLVLLRLTPNPLFVCSAANKVIVLFLLGVVTAVALILTDAAVHMLLTFAIGIPVVLVHAVFWRDDLHFAGSYGVVDETSTGEVEVAVPLVSGDHV